MDDAAREIKPPDNGDDIDYMHPNGKPDHPQAAKLEDDKPSWHDLRIALQEADGHYMPKDDPYIGHK